MLILPNPNKARFNPRPIAFTDIRNSGTPLTSHSQTGVSFGQPHPARKTLICISGRRAPGAGSTSFTNVTINGISAIAASVAGGVDGNRSRIQFFYVENPTGETGTISWSISGDSTGCNLHVWSVIGSFDLANPITTVNDSSAPFSQNINVAEGRIAVAGFFNASGSNKDLIIGWSGLNDDGTVIGSYAGSAGSLYAISALSGLTVGCTAVAGSLASSNNIMQINVYGQ